MRALSWLPLPVSTLLGAGLGMLLYGLHASRRRVVHINIARCFPELTKTEQGRLVRRHFRALGQAVLNMGIAWWASPRRLNRLVCWRGREHYDQARAAKRRIILLVPHVVGVELGGMRLTIDVPLVDIFRHPNSAVVRAVMERSRTRFGGRLVEHVRGLVPVIVQDWNSGEVLTLAYANEEAVRRTRESGELAACT